MKGSGHDLFTLLRSFFDLVLSGQMPPKHLILKLLSKVILLTTVVLDNDQHVCRISDLCVCACAWCITIPYTRSVHHHESLIGMILCSGLGAWDCCRSFSSETPSDPSRQKVKECRGPKQSLLRAGRSWPSCHERQWVRDGPAILSIWRGNFLTSAEHFPSMSDLLLLQDTFEQTIGWSCRASSMVFCCCCR